MSEVIGSRPVSRPWPRITLFALACFAVGVCHTVRVNIVGEASLAELLLPILALAALARPEGRRVFGLRAFWWLLLAMLVTLAGYVISDVIQETPEARYLRGWGRMALVITGFISLSAIACARKQNLWWFCAGMALGRVIYLRFVLGTPIGMWKFSHDGFGYGEPMSLAVAAAAWFLPPRLAAVLFALLGLLSIYYDFRIQCLVCLLLAVFMWVRAARPTQPLRAGLGGMRLAFLVLGAMSIVWMGLKFSEDEYSSNRRDVSDIGRSVGKRFAIKAIAESPLLGYGSWSKSREFERMHAEAMREVAGRDASRFRIGDSSSATHSMVLQAWVEGGILGIAFFVALSAMLLPTVIALVLRRPLDGVSALLLYFSLYGLWHIVMSAFAAPLRVHLAFAAACVVFMVLEQRERARGEQHSRRDGVSVSPRPQGTAPVMDARAGKAF